MFACNITFLNGCTSWIIIAFHKQNVKFKLKLFHFIETNEQTHLQRKSRGYKYLYLSA